MRRLVLGAAAFGLISATGTTAAEPSVTDLLAGTQWVWLGPGQTLEKIRPEVVTRARNQGCATPTMSFRRSGTQLVRFDNVSGSPDPTITTFGASRVVKETGGLRIESFWGAEGPTPNVVMTLTRNGELLTLKKSALFGDWYYIRCAQMGPQVYTQPPGSVGRRRP